MQHGAKGGGLGVGRVKRSRNTSLARRWSDQTPTIGKRAVPPRHQNEKKCGSIFCIFFAAFRPLPPAAPPLPRRPCHVFLNPCHAAPATEENKNGAALVC